MDTPIYEHYLTGQSVLNFKSKQDLLMMIDFGMTLNMEESRELYRNLMEYCSFLAHEDALAGKTDQEKIGIAELNWTDKLLNVVKTLHKATDCSPRLKHLLAVFNSKHNYQVINYFFVLSIYRYFYSFIKI